MADEDRIREPYRIAGIRGIATANVFPRTRVTRKAKRAAKEEKPPPKKSEAGKSGDEAKRIDIEA
jgi:hypothetical protein